VGAALIENMIERVRRAGMQSIQWASLITDEDEWFGILQTHGFECLRSERSFEVAYKDAWTRVMQLHERHRSQIPAGWRTEPIRDHVPDATLELIGADRLMHPEEVRHYWQPNSRPGFDLDLSCILFDGQRLFGAFLLRRMGEGLYIDVQVVRETNPRRRSLGDLLMLHHDAQRVPADGPIRWIWFRSGEAEHRQTANLALRMGGREMPPRHVLAKAL
jgi:hypothetical protein